MLGMCRFFSCQVSLLTFQSHSNSNSLCLRSDILTGQVTSSHSVPSPVSVNSVSHPTGFFFSGSTNMLPYSTNCLFPNLVKKTKHQLFDLKIIREIGWRQTHKQYNLIRYVSSGKQAKNSTGNIMFLHSLVPRFRILSPVKTSLSLKLQFTQRI